MSDVGGQRGSRDRLSPRPHPRGERRRPGPEPRLVGNPCAGGLRPGDRIDVDLPQGRVTYRVQGTRILPPTALWITKRVGYDRLVLGACHPLSRPGTDRPPGRGQAAGRYAGAQVVTLAHTMRAPPFAPAGHLR